MFWFGMVKEKTLFDNGGRIKNKKGSKSRSSTGERKEKKCNPDVAVMVVRARKEKKSEESW